MKQSKLDDEVNLPPIVRVSVSLPRGLHAELEQIARDKKVSLAWVIRDAAEKYVADQWPLLAQTK
ncbi:ribbon-helix-helix domain-containing protein [Thiobacillus sp.]|jgi:metal-responsive CopG/Arc/MetJ family transcriptional regulator|uniref:ribbon-helix-helix domain-containing protein n=1 Tax=Thiobacillus sp. TaxID=924 RepID=UPI0025D9E7FC|nr:ribbon-helix-helix domain-containing protein [Thiobacillus sp.]